MRIITFDQIKKKNISPAECVNWVESALRMKYEVFLPKKTSISFHDGDVFFNTMPCLIPQINRFGVKTVSRYPGRIPSISGEILLYDSNTGSLLALMDADWITAMRTGAVAASTIKHLRKKEAKTYSFIGLGNTTRATLLCLLDIEPNKKYNIKLLKYKDQAELFIDRFKHFNTVSFEIVDSIKGLINHSDVIVSEITVTNDILGKDEWFDEGVLVVPIHTRGFQNCDLFFDKIFADDTAHVMNFKNFEKFKAFDEFANVLLNKVQGRENDKERILAYNIGLALHDVYFASKILDLEKDERSEYKLRNPLPKFLI